MSRLVRERAPRRALRLASVIALASVFLTSIAPAGAQEATVPPAAMDLAPRADGRAISVCGTAPLGSMTSTVRDSVVEVEGPLAMSLGFVFGEPDLVVVPLEVARRGRGVIVRRGGVTMTATIAALDEEGGLAMLRVPDLRATPLQPSAIPVERGTATLHIGQPWDAPGDADQVTPGSVTTTRGIHFRSTGGISYSFDVGAPVVDCFGRVLGVSTLSVDEAVTIDRAEMLLRRVRQGAEPFVGEVAVWPGLRALLEVDDQAWGGGEIGVSVVDRDLWEASAHGRILGRGEVEAPDAEGWTTERWGVRGGLDLRAGARIMVTEGMMPFYVVPQIGVGFDASAEGGTVSRGQVEGDGCSEVEPCGVVEASRKLPVTTDLDVGPQVGLSLRLGALDLGYTFRMDATDVGDSSHQVGFGLAF